VGTHLDVLASEAAKHAAAFVEGLATDIKLKSPASPTKFLTEFWGISRFPKIVGTFVVDNWGTNVAELLTAVTG